MSGSADGDISIVLSPIQVEQVVRAASRSTAPGVAALISGSLRRRNHTPAANAPGAAGGAAQRPVPADRRLSSSLLRGLSILSCFASTDEERGIVELARQAGMSASTAHRYALTLIELGLLERSPHSRKYRLPAEISR
ncbi:MAG TPA: helix-turn-helix domain-containing protein [Solirubrobacteraceae bacterium]